MNDNWTLPEEIWMPIPSMPGIEASTHGRIRQIPFEGKMPNGSPRMYGGKPTFGSICSSTPDARHLYFIRRMMGKNLKVHFGVCEAFHGKNPSGRNGVRHLNENGLDNRPGNLMWADQKTNLNDPDIKWFHLHRVSPKGGHGMTKREKRAGIYDSIRDIGLRQLELRAANDNLGDQVAAMSISV